MTLDYTNRHVVVTGGTGALGAAVVKLLTDAGANCHVPSRRELDLTGEPSVRDYYAALPALWASIHIAGGFAAAPIAQTSAVASLTVSLAEELAPERIWVNAVVPSIMDTPANRKAMPDADYSKWPSLDDVAATILFLASPQNAATRGALVPVYGQS